MNVYLFLRKTEDWKNVQLEECRQSPPVRLGELAHFSVLQEWNERLATTWQAFRFELQQKALESWAKAGISILRNRSQVEEKNDEDVVVPIDDDDWVHPDFVSFVKTEMKDNGCLQWTQALNTYFPSHRVITQWGLTDYQRKTVHSTSDHGLRISILRHLDNDTWGKTMHGHGNVWKQSLFTRRMYVPEAMTCYNHHIGSHSFLVETKSLDELLKRVGFIQEIPNWASAYEDNIHWLDRLTTKCTQPKNISHVKQL